ncbi:MAG: AarF/ABC1/UbiB kinase family protein [Cyclobacteriaceae bacterium]|nr:AarF/ABC1/UbiB kinase family protein [Cyclobacteriaceae bacterium]
MKEQKSIPTTKVQRATKFITTGAKIGRNYLKHYGKKLVDPNISRDQLNEDNASDIYDSLSKLKGSALKVAQMLSMDKNLLPKAYQQQFSMAQYSAPPLSYPLVVKTFQTYFGKNPGQIFDSFSTKAVNAASMGQVHQATLKGKTLAVKIQYPGVSDTVKSDLAMVKPIALRMFKLSPVEYEEFIGEVELRLLEEADYTLELKRSIEMSEQSRKIKHLVFPKYYPEFSAKKILTMDWLEGLPLGEYLKKGKPSKAIANKLGQAMWDFYHFQFHQLKAVHADPHPGNFIITPDEELGVIDFGCVKEIPEDFYQLYFQLHHKDILQDPVRLEKIFYQMRFIYEDDSESEKKFFRAVFIELLDLLARPFHTKTFDFADPSYFETLYKTGEKISNMKELRDSKKARGIKHALYINRTYFGLYSILNELGATVETHSFVPSWKSF